MSYTYEYPRPCVTTDITVFRENSERMELLLIKRKNPPYEGMWAFPGGFINEDETLEQCAMRELEEETTLKNITLSQFKTYSAINRDPRHRTISTVFVGFLTSEETPKDGDDAAETQWFKIDELPPLAFDHQQIIEDIFDLFKEE